MSNKNEKSSVLAALPKDFAEITQFIGALIATPGPIAFNLLQVDASGSMGSDVEAVLQLMKLAIEDMKAEKEAARRTALAIQYFESRAHLVVPPTQLNLVQTPTTYVPSGGTALYGTVADGIILLRTFHSAVMDACQRMGRQVPDILLALVVITDGYNQNQDSQLRHQELLALSKKAAEEGIVLRAIAIRMDPENLAQMLGFKPGWVTPVDRSDEGFHTATRATSQTFTESMTRTYSRNPPQPSAGGTFTGVLVTDPDEIPTTTYSSTPPRKS